MNSLKVNQVKFILSMYQSSQGNAKMMELYNNNVQDMVRQRQISKQTLDLVNEIIEAVFKYRGAEVRATQFNWYLQAVEQGALPVQSLKSELDNKVKQKMVSPNVADVLCKLYDLAPTSSEKPVGKSIVKDTSKNNVPTYVFRTLKKVKSMYKNMAVLRVQLKDSNDELIEDGVKYLDFDRIESTPEIIDWSLYKANVTVMYKVENFRWSKGSKLVKYLYLTNGEIDDYSRLHPDCCDL